MDEKNNPPLRDTAFDGRPGRAEAEALGLIPLQDTASDGHPGQNSGASLRRGPSQDTAVDGRPGQNSGASLRRDPPQDTAFDGRPGYLRRVRQVAKDGLAVDEIKARVSGNYIFSFGFPGSGKTTFQWMLMNYLMNEGPFRTEISVPDRPGGADWVGRTIINAWKGQWIEGRFPDPTPCRRKRHS